MAKNIYLEAIKAGREIVIISQLETYDSAIHFLNETGEKWRRYGRNIGLIETPFNEKEFSIFIETMQQENAYIYIRGAAFNDR